MSDLNEVTPMFDLLAFSELHVEELDISVFSEVICQNTKIELNVALFLKVRLSFF